MKCKVNKDHFSHLRFENQFSGSNKMTYVMTRLTHCRQTNRQTHRPSFRVDLALQVGLTEKVLHPH